MSQIHVNQITGHLRRTYSGLIDLSDMEAAPDPEKEKAFLTRALAAFAIAQLSGAAEADAAASVTDGQGDNGIDALHYDGAARTLYVVQSKWFSTGHGSFDRADMLKFTKGFKDLTSLSFNRFNKKVQNKSEIVKSSFFDDQAKYMLVMIYTGKEPLADEPTRDLQDCLNEFNDTANEDASELLEARVLRQSDVHGLMPAARRAIPSTLM